MDQGNVETTPLIRIVSFRQQGILPAIVYSNFLAVPTVEKILDSQEKEM